MTDNVDVACTVIEKAAMDRAVAEVDDAFADAYALRRTHREVLHLSRPALWRVLIYPI